MAELEAAQRAEQEAQAIAKESAAQVRCAAAQRDLSPVGLDVGDTIHCFALHAPSK